jgi:hypothetical protein
MSEPVRACSRCGRAFEESTSSISVTRGPLHDEHPELELCPWCSESLVRWFDRRKRPARETSHHEHRRPSGRTRRSRSRRRLVLRSLVLVSLFCGMALLMFLLLNTLHSTPIGE